MKTTPTVVSAMLRDPQRCVLKQRGYGGGVNDALIQEKVALAEAANYQEVLHAGDQLALLREHEARMVDVTPGAGDD
jgi:hypothetical protein